MFQVCCWNVRGLNDRGKRAMVKSVVSRFRTSILCLQESKVSEVSRSFLNSFVGRLFNKCHFISANGASGGVVTCWNADDFSCLEVLVRVFSLTLRLVHRASGLSFFVTNVYGPRGWEGKAAFCSELGALKAHCLGPWVVCGDFNLTRNQNERRGRTWSCKLMHMFSNLINELELMDLPIGNQLYTWSNQQSIPTLAKLDRFLISTEWDATFPYSVVSALPRITSDHSPLLLRTLPKQDHRIFRFDKVWLTRNDFNLLVPVWWNELANTTSGVLSFAAKLRHCRKRIKEWCTTNFYSIRNSKQNTAEEIHKLDLLEERHCLTASQTQTRIHLKSTLKNIIEDEELLWQERA